MLASLSSPSYFLLPALLYSLPLSGVLALMRSPKVTWQGRRALGGHYGDMLLHE